MKNQGREKAVWDAEVEVKNKDSWINHINWDEVAPLMCFSTEYPKGTQTTTRSLCYTQSIGVIAEQIHLAQKSRFKTVSEILRCALHIGISVMYKVFLSGKSKTIADFYFNNLEGMKEIMEIGQIVATLREKETMLDDMVRKGNISKESANEAWFEMCKNIPDGYKEMVFERLSGIDINKVEAQKERIKTLMEITA